MKVVIITSGLNPLFFTEKYSVVTTCFKSNNACCCSACRSLSHETGLTGMLNSAGFKLRKLNDIKRHASLGFVLVTVKFWKIM